MRKSIILLFLVFMGIGASAQSIKDFRYGHYYTLENKKVDGFLYCPPTLNSVIFKQDNETEQITIGLDKIRAIVLANSKDSLIVKTEGGKEKRKYLATLVASTPTRNFFCKYRVYSTIGSQSMSMSAAPTMYESGGRGLYGNAGSFSSTSGVTSVEETYFYEDGNSTYQLTKKNYIDVLSKSFADNPVLIKQFQSNYLGFNDLGLIFKKYTEDNSKGR